MDNDAATIVEHKRTTTLRTEGTRWREAHICVLGMYHALMLIAQDAARKLKATLSETML